MNLELLLHFLKFDIQTNSLEIKDWVERLYVSNDLTHRFNGKSSQLRLRVERKDAPEAKRLRAPVNGTFAETNLCNGRCYYEDGRFYSANHGEYWHEMEYDLNTHTIHANLGGTYLHRPQAVISNIIRPILQSFILPFYGLKTLHGAILSKGGRTVFLSGEGGAGKTTTAAQLVRDGYALLSDDGPFFFTDGGYAYALSSLDYLHLTENSLKLFPELRMYVVGKKDNRDKFAIRLSDLQNGGPWRQPLQITDFIRLQRLDDVVTPRIEKINRNAVHRGLLDESMVIFRRAPFRTSSYPFREYSEFVFDLLTKVIQGAQTHSLVFANHHLPDLPALINQL